MKNFSQRTKEQLKTTITQLILKNNDTASETEKLITLNQFHDELKKNPNRILTKQINRIKSSLEKNCRDLASLDYANNLYHPLVTALNNSIQKINHNNIDTLFAVTPDNFTRLRYRYFLLIGFLWNWAENTANSNDDYIREFRSTIINVLNDNGLNNDDILLSFDESDSTEERTFKTLYQEAINTNVLSADTSIADHIERELKKKKQAETEKLAKLEAERAIAKVAAEKAAEARRLAEEHKQLSAEEQLALEQKKKKELHDQELFNAALEKTKEALKGLTNLRDQLALEESPNKIIFDTCKQSTDFLATLEREVKSKLTYEEATYILNEQTGMTSSLVLAYTPKIDDETRKTHIDTFNKHALNLTRLAEKHDNRDRKILTNSLLLLLGLSMIAISIACLYASAHGNFLNIFSFAPSVIKTHLVRKSRGLPPTEEAYRTMSDMGSNFFLSGIFGLFAGFSVTALALHSLFGNRSPVRTHAASLTQAVNKSATKLEPLNDTGMPLNKLSL